MPQSTVRDALAASRRFDRDAHGRRTPPVGYDVFEIVGHTTVGSDVYLTLQSAGWVRDVDALLERQTRAAAGEEATS